MAHDAHDAHDDGHGHAHGAHPHVDGDDLPAHGPVLEEPRSPRWLPFLGAALFGVLLIFWLASPSEADEAKEAAAAAASAAASASASASASAAPSAVIEGH